MKFDNQVTANIGLYYACYKLSLKGWNVMPTARNARGIDIIAYNKYGTQYIGVQVKALSKRTDVPLGNTLEKVMGDYWIIVNNVAKEPNVFHIVTGRGKVTGCTGQKMGHNIGLSLKCMMSPNLKGHGTK